MWNTIPDFPNYEINREGVIRNKTTKHYKKITVGRDGYPKVELYNKGVRKHFKLHRLLAIIFIPNPENKREVNHIDMNKMNYSLDNLEWVTPSENMAHVIQNEDKDSKRRIAASENVKKATEANKKKVNKYSLDGDLLESYESISEASRQTGIRRASISEAYNGKRKSAGGYIWK